MRQVKCVCDWVAVAEGEFTHNIADWSSMVGEFKIAGPSSLTKRAGIFSKTSMRLSWDGDQITELSSKMRLMKDF